MQMSFTDEEKKRWLKEKREREGRKPLSFSEPSKHLEGSSDFAICLHCNNPFRRSEGTVTQDAAICDVCNY